MTDVRSFHDEPRQVSTWATGGVVFAATVMIMVGAFEFFQGLAAVLEDQFFVTLSDYAFEIDVTAWGWIHLILGGLLVLAGFGLFSGNAVAGGVAILLAILSAIANFFFIPYYPFWTLLIIAVDVFVIWAIARSGIFDTT